MNPEPATAQLREEIDRAIASGPSEVAAARMDALWRQEPSPASAAFLVPRIEKLRGSLNLSPLRVGILRSHTLEPVIPLLRAAAFRFRVDLSVHVGSYNAYMQETLDGNSSLYCFAPDVVIVAIRLTDLAQELWQDFSGLDATAAQHIAQRVTGTFEQIIASFRMRSQAALIIHNLEQPVDAGFGVLDGHLELSQRETIQAVNRELRCIARQHRGVYVLDYDSLVAKHGRLFWQDERKFLAVRLPIAANGLIHLANEWLRFLVPLSGRISKVLVVDLDNTLWGGVIGEDGLERIKLGPEYPGAVYQALQRAMLDLSRRGVLLAICSKNNPEEAMEALEKHPGMLLRPADFAATRINWNDKEKGLREIAAELNIGLDAIAFLDDNPFERERVRSAIPEILVIDLPQDPMGYASAVRDCAAFERLTISAEDRTRTSLYAKRQERTRAEEGFQSKEEFFRYLLQEAEIEAATPVSIPRIAQLTQKTNQFNVTTRRYSEQQITEMAEKPGWQVLSMRLKDRFGDHGLVGVAITRDDEQTCEIDSFLLSSRVIGRSVETAFLSYIAEQAVARGRTQLMGWFVPTKKNAPTAEFYSQSGFSCQSQGPEGQSWTLDLKSSRIRCPDWIRLNVLQGGRVDGGVATTGSATRV